MEYLLRVFDVSASDAEKDMVTLVVDTLAGLVCIGVPANSVVDKKYVKVPAPVSTHKGAYFVELPGENDCFATHVWVSKRDLISKQVVH